MGVASVLKLQKLRYMIMRCSIMKWTKIPKTRNSISLICHMISYAFQCNVWEIPACYTVVCRHRDVDGYTITYEKNMLQGILFVLIIFVFLFVCFLFLFLLLFFKFFFCNFFAITGLLCRLVVCNILSRFFKRQRIRATWDEKWCQTNRTRNNSDRTSQAAVIVKLGFRILKSTRNENNKFLKYKISICLDHTCMYIVPRVPYTCNSQPLIVLCKVSIVKATRMLTAFQY